MQYKENFVKFASGSPVGALLLSHIAPLHIQLKETTLEQIEKWIEQEQLPLERGDIVRAARTMDELGIARFVVGRRGAPSRIEWNFDTSSLDGDAQSPGEASGTAADGRPNEGRSPDPATGLDAVARENTSEPLQHSFRVRPDFSISFRLPADFSPPEAERLCAFIKSLPF